MNELMINKCRKENQRAIKIDFVQSFVIILQVSPQGVAIHSIRESHAVASVHCSAGVWGKHQCVLS